MKDSGNYTCLAGDARGHITLQFKSRFPEQSSNRIDFDDDKPQQKQKGTKSKGIKVLPMKSVVNEEKPDNSATAVVAELQKLAKPSDNRNFEDLAMATTPKGKTVEQSDISSEFPAPQEIQRQPDSNADALRQLDIPQDFGPNQSRTADRLPGKSVLQVDNFKRNQLNSSPI